MTEEDLMDMPGSVFNRHLEQPPAKEERNMVQKLKIKETGKGTFEDPYIIGDIFNKADAVGISMGNMDMAVNNGSVYQGDPGIHIEIMARDKGTGEFKKPGIQFIPLDGFTQKKTWQKGSSPLLYLTPLGWLIPVPAPHDPKPEQGKLFK